MGHPLPQQAWQGLLIRNLISEKEGSTASPQSPITHVSSRLSILWACRPVGFEVSNHFHFKQVQERAKQGLKRKIYHT